jgi:CheY-like chemotaxis protein
MDPTDRGNEVGHRFLSKAARGRCSLELVKTPEEALAALTAGKYDLVLSRWGNGAGGPADAVRLLEGMRQRDLRAPVIVFASGEFATTNREIAINLGALEYTWKWETLFREIDRRFAGPPDPEKT